MLQERKIHCLQAGPCIFQPGNCTGWGGDGVKGFLKWRRQLVSKTINTCKYFLSVLYGCKLNHNLRNRKGGTFFAQTNKHWKNLGRCCRDLEENQPRSRSGQCLRFVRGESLNYVRKRPRRQAHINASKRRLLSSAAGLTRPVLPDHQTTTTGLNSKS